MMMACPRGLPRVDRPYALIPKIAITACYPFAVIGLLLILAIGLLMAAVEAVPRLRAGMRRRRAAGLEARPAKFPANSLFCLLAGNLNSLLAGQGTRFKPLISHSIIGWTWHFSGTNKKIPVISRVAGNCRRRPQRADLRLSLLAQRPGKAQLVAVGIADVEKSLTPFGITRCSGRAVAGGGEAGMQSVDVAVVKDHPPPP